MASDTIGPGGLARENFAYMESTGLARCSVDFLLYFRVYFLRI